MQLNNTQAKFRPVEEKLGKDSFFIPKKFTRMKCNNGNWEG